MQDSIRDKRRGPDLLQRSFLWLTIICWGLFLLAMLTFHYARPEIEYGLLRYWDIDIRSDWLLQLQQLFLYSLWSCCFVTLLSLALNFSRNRRAGDYHIYYFLLLLIIVLVSLLTYYLGVF
jgi:hypothetical protein